jgi:NAD(P)H-nitrite reductase large subunit
MQSQYPALVPTLGSIMNRFADEVVCHCLQVTHQELEVALACQPVFSLKEMCKQTGAGAGCTACHHQLKQLLQKTVFTVQSTAKCG